MSQTIDYYYDFGSPTAYLAWAALPKIAEKAGAKIRWRPMLLGGLFKLQDNRPPAAVKDKGKWMFHDIRRWAKRYDVPFRFNPHFPVNTLHLMRGAYACDSNPLYLETCFNAIWRDEKKMDDPDEAGRVLGDAGFDPAEFLARTADDDVKEGLKQATQEAKDRGVFGAPTFFLDDRIYFGQDRLDMLAEDLGVDICEVFPTYRGKAA